MSIWSSDPWAAGPPVPHILVVGMNHHTAPVSLRQRVALAGETTDATLAYLGQAAVQAVVLSTCNRTLERMTTALVNKLLHGPLVYLKQATAPSPAVEVVEGLFQIERPCSTMQSQKEAS